MTQQVRTTSPETGDRSVAELVSDLSEQMSRLVRDEMRLATAELQRKGKRAGLGAGLAGAAGVTAFLGGATLVACVVLALALVMPAWLAALIVGVALLVVAGLMAAVARVQLKRATPPLPREAMDGVQRDVQVMKENVRS
ncbi:Putative Holin-X, holin superfamily III [Amycolatopsis arida]|uniref:Putative Holin-X, holin superfamily III n=1 Tax=Amycolatopsis arida TaxID=587909 RepID=A0A1I5XHF5_9PSEU|nr:phage holin family protein [Amycolatopsis arida]TDX97448.1 putative superfamily III holin-X [Amycolatopsis arida]SFQ31408.1 Putative Holin-X, holin superfamily III [Amycolatopsis arida]